MAAPDRRQVILDAALELFCERTYSGTAMPLIAARAGVAAGTIYRYFASKEELGNTLYRESKLAMQRSLSAHARAGSAREEFAGLWQGLWAFAREYPSAARFLETQQHAAYLDLASRAVSDAVATAAADYVRRGQAAGAVRPGDPRLLIALAFGAFVGLMKEADDKSIALDDDAVTAAEEAVWAMLRA